MNYFNFTHLLHNGLCIHIKELFQFYSFIAKRTLHTDQMNYFNFPHLLHNGLHTHQMNYFNFTHLSVQINSFVLTKWQPNVQVQMVIRFFNYKLMPESSKYILNILVISLQLDHDFENIWMKSVNQIRTQPTCLRLNLLIPVVPKIVLAILALSLWSQHFFENIYRNVYQIHVFSKVSWLKVS